MTQSHTKQYSQTERREILQAARDRLEDTITEDKLSDLSLLLGLNNVISYWEQEIAFHTERVG